MTRYEHRKACAEAIAKELWGRNEPGPSWQEYLPDAYAAFDALHGIARVCAVESTSEMRLDGGAAQQRSCQEYGDPEVVWDAMSAAGDLTTPPEKKP